MNKETYETLKRVISKARELIREKYANRKRLNKNEVWEQATFIRDITDIEGWIDEVEKEYDSYEAENENMSY